MVRALAVIFFATLAGNAGAQILEFGDLTKLPAGIVNSKGEESMPLLSPDQKKLYFIRSVYDGNIGGQYGGQDIWIAEKAGTVWKSANNRIDNLNDKNNNILSGISRDGRTLYVLRSSPEEKLAGLYLVRIDGRQAGPAEFVPLPGIENEDFVGLFVSVDYDVIFLSMRGKDSRGAEDIYISLKDRSGAWSRPRNLGPTINSNGFEISPFLSADKRRLYFASNGMGGYGDADIFYSERLYNSWETWSAPVNLGEVVNSKKFDAYFSIYGDSVAYFCSNRDQQLSDIYKVKVSEKIGLLDPGQTYVSASEWNSLVGKNVQKKLEFATNATTLSSAQRELLYFIANKISGMRDVGIHLVVREEENTEVTRNRLKEIYGALRQVGIEARRIRETQNQYAIKSGEDSGLIEIMLYRENAD